MASNGFHYCEPCDKTFTTNKALLRHWRENKRHSSQAANACDICSQTFARNHDLQRHIREQHEDGKQPCPRCAKILRPDAPHRTDSGAVCQQQGAFALSETGLSNEQLLGHPHNVPQKRIATYADALRLNHKADATLEVALEFNAEALQQMINRTPAEDDRNTVCSKETDASTKAKKRSLDGEALAKQPTQPSITTYADALKCFPGTPNTDPMSSSTSSSILSAPIVLAYRPRTSETTGKLRHAIPCGICRKTFPPNKPQNLIKHLDYHFKELQRSWRCHECQIGFCFKKDLEKHLASAKQGDCGFMFKHNSKCSGHHPPSTEAPRKEDRKRNRFAWTDDDRFDFCFRIRHWEQAQQRALRSTIEAIFEEEDNSGKGASMSCGLSTWSVEPSKLSKLSTPSYVRFGLRNSVALDNGRQEALSTASEPDESSSGFIRAVCNGDADLVSLHLDAGAQINLGGLSGLYPLHYATIFDSIDIIKILLDRGANISPTDYRGRTPMSYAVSRGSIAAVQMLLAVGAEVDISHLESASAAGNTDIVSEIMARLVASSTHRITEVRWNEALATAVGHDDVTLVDLICRQRDVLNLHGLSLAEHMSFAIRNSSSRMVKLLLQHNASVDGTLQWPTLHSAVDANKRKILKELLKRGADIDAVDGRGNTALSLALQYGSSRKSIIDLLIGHTANINEQCALTALSAAITRHDIESVLLLLSLGADVGLGDTHGRTPLYHAVTKGYEDLIKLLLSAGAEVDSTWIEDKDLSPLHIAISDGDLDLVRLLVRQRKNKSMPHSRWFGWTKMFREHVCDTQDEHHQCSLCLKCDRISKAERASRAAKMETIILEEISQCEIA